LTLAAVAGIYGLSSTSITEVCIPDIDEATRFKNNMIQQQKEKDAKIKAAAETTPAVKPV
jgi:hypothetical protein